MAAGLGAVETRTSRWTSIVVSARASLLVLSAGLASPARGVEPPTADTCATAAVCADRYTGLPCQNGCDWSTARQACIAYGGVLAKADTTEERAGLADVAAAANLLVAWIGATDSAAEGLFEGEFAWLGPDGSIDVNSLIGPGTENGYAHCYTAALPCNHSSCPACSQLCCVTASV